MAKKKKKNKIVAEVGLDGTITKLDGKSSKNNNLIAEVGLDGTISKYDIAPVKKEKKKDENKRTWFSGGAFGDGYDFGDVTKTVLGTAADVGTNIIKGAATAGENLGKLVAGGIAEVSDFIGQDEYADKVRNRLAGKDEKVNKRLEKYTLSSNLNKVSNALDPVSFTGEKLDDLSSSVGTMGAALSTQMVGVPGWIVMGGSSAGGELENAYKSGATSGEAWGSAAITGISEILFEKLSGGIKFGGRTLDEGAKRLVTDAIANKTAKTLTKFGMDVVGEGAEEVLTEIASNLGKKLTYEDEKTLNEVLFSEEALDSYLEAFIGGAVMGGGFNASRTYNSIKTGRDYDTGLSTNEQRVVDKEVENRVVEAEKDGTKLTNKQKVKIEEQVKKDLEKGYIDIDAIEGTLGGETYNQYKSITDKKKSLENEINELENKKNTDITVKEFEKLQELRKEYSELDTDSVKNKLSSEVDNLTKNDYLLRNSYNEKANKSVKFDADLTKYDAKQQKVVKKAIESGILNNTNKTHDFVDMVAKLSADKGVAFDFTNNENLKNSGFILDGKQVDGFVSKNGITLNIDSNNALNKVVGHEITHVLEGTDLYTELQQAVKEYATTKGVYDARLKELTKLYKDVDNANIENELTSDLVGEYLFTDTDFVNNLSATKPNVFKKIYDEIKYLLKVATAGSKEARQLEKVKKAFEDAYKQNASNTIGNEVKYSLTDNQGRTLTKEQQERFKDSKVRDENGDLKVVYHGSDVTDITVFKKDKFGDVGINFLTDDPDIADTYRNKKGRRYEFYADIKKPLIIDGEGKNWNDILVGDNPKAENIYNSLTTQEKEYLTELAKKMNDMYLGERLGRENSIEGFYQRINAYDENLYDRLSEISNARDKIYDAARYNWADVYLKDVLGTRKNTNQLVREAYESGEYDGVIFKNIVDRGTNYHKPIGRRVSNVYVTFNSNQIKNVDNFNPTDSDDIRYSLKEEGQQTTRTSNNVYGSDVKLQVEEAIAPLQEKIETLTEHLDTVVNATEQEIAPVRDDYAPLTEADLPTMEQQYSEAPKENIAPIRNNLTAEESQELDSLENLPFDLDEAEQSRMEELQEKENPASPEEKVTETKDLFKTRDYAEVGDRKVKAYQYDNPEVKPYFQDVAEDMLHDLGESLKGERYVVGDISQLGGGDYSFSGQKRFTAPDIAELLDGIDGKYKLTYKQIRKGLENIIKDEGAENNAASKRIEFYLDKRLREGYTTLDGYKIDANQEYLKVVEEAELNNFYSNIPIDESLIPPEVETMKAPMVKASNTQLNDEIASIENEIEAPVQRRFNLEEETITDEEVSELEKKQQRAYKKLGSKEDYVSNKASELYDEVKNLKKGVKASYELGRVLDVGFANINELTKGMPETKAKELKNKIWRDITTSLLNVKAKPLNTVNKDSTIEAVIRQNLNREYDSKKNDIDNMKEEDLVTKTKKELRKALLGTEVQKEFITSALDNAKNRSMALMNNTDTIRNTELVFGRDAGKVINDVIFQKEIDNEADSIAWQNQERQSIKDLGIKARSKESAAVQKYGEKQYVETNGEVVSYTDEDLAREFPNVETQEKIKNAAKVIRSKYDTYIDEANNILTKLGFDPIPKRKDYMRHFQELNDVFSRYGIPFNAQSMTEHVLPTDINGLTENWSPQKNYFANMQQRKGLKTTYDAITGIDGYIGGIANLIYHTEDIQRGRAFEELIRETYGEDKGWDNLDNLPDDLKQARAEKIQDNHLSNYAAWVHEWTNNVAGKKSKIDRSVESMFGRKAFSFLDNVRKQVGSNMIGFNLSSSLTNLIAPVQAMAKTNKLAVAKGTADTIKNMFIKDNFMEKNKFLTSRMGTDMISKNAWQKIQDAGFVFMKGMDWFSSNQIVRSKYYELRAKGVSEAEAHAQAGQFAARILGDRTKGANAQLYNSKLIGLVTQFQLEVNNQLYSMFYDTYQESKANAKGNAVKTAAGMTFTLGQLFAFTHLFGKTFESIAGYNPTFDVIGMLMTALGLGEEEDEKKTTSERLKDAADQLVDSLPYVNILTGGGRIPVASGIPNLVGVATGGKDQYGNELTLDGELKKLLYLIPPTGGNQVKKTTQGLGMFDEDLPVSGSYTDSGNLRFPVEDTPLNRIQAGLFGQYANENASDYFDNERAPLKSKQIKEYADLDMPISDYWDYREGLKKLKKTEDKFNYINNLDVSDKQKNIMINNAISRKEKVDMRDYGNYGSLEEFDYAKEHPEKYKAITQIDTYDNYKYYQDNINAIKKNFETDEKLTSKQKTALSKQRKAAVQQYIESLNLGVPQKVMLEKMAGGYSIKDYEEYMFQYIESLPMSAEEKQALHSQLFD